MTLDERVEALAALVDAAESKIRELTRENAEIRKWTSAWIAAAYEDAAKYVDGIFMQSFGADDMRKAAGKDMIEQAKKNWETIRAQSLFEAPSDDE
ncbi:hypothetical protein [Haematobacter genomosp. 1]|uniref:Uncharacterized protein n=1 Tax=Haematobacter genomosp. 1 TaxID=366618 RepID=A0A212ADP5_9RHOB|nr:hypothetical protein [Haematobacter genomosp. 1]OWJ79357.1 hypothetical protein CDV49_05595 [Haematobacter genomosp. 1]